MMIMDKLSYMMENVEISKKLWENKREIYFIKIKIMQSIFNHFNSWKEISTRVELSTSNFFSLLTHCSYFPLMYFDAILWSIISKEREISFNFLKHELPLKELSQKPFSKSISTYSLFIIHSNAIICK